HSVKALFLENGDTVLEDFPAHVPELVPATLGKIVGHENRNFHLARRCPVLLEERGFLIDDMIKDLTSAWHCILSCRAFDEVDFFNVNTSEIPLMDTERDFGRMRPVELQSGDHRRLGQANQLHLKWLKIAISHLLGDPQNLPISTSK